MTTKNNTEASAQAGIPKPFRRLKSHEIVSLGDFVADEQGGFELWEGPSGFRSDSFVKAIYRRGEGRLSAITMLK
jgi:hypothetical protein